MDIEQEKRIQRARVHLQSDYPFYGYILMQLEIIQDELNTETAKTNGHYIKYNPGFISTLSNKQLKTLLIHEVEHIIKNHHIRAKGRDFKYWNEATDYAINYDLVYNYNLEPIKDMLLDHNYSKLSSEEIYNLLEKSKQNTVVSGSNSGENKNKPTFGEVEPSNSGKSLVEEKEHVRQLMNDGMVYAKKIGKLSSSLERTITKRLKPKIPWQRLLRDWIESKIKEDFNWMQRDSRILEYYFPSLYTEEEEIGYIVIAIDTSGSIQQELLNNFISEINSLRKVFKFKTLILSCNTDIQSEQEFNENEEIKVKLKGGGGTKFSPVFKKVEELKKKPIGLLYFTDLCCSDFGKKPNYDVLWLNYYINREVPFGKVINLK